MRGETQGRTTHIFRSALRRLAVRFYRQTRCPLSSGDGSDPLWSGALPCACGGGELVLRHSHTLSNTGREKGRPSSVGLTFLCAFMLTSLAVIPPHSIKYQRLDFVAIPSELAFLGNQGIIPFVLPMQENLAEFTQKLFHRMGVK